MAKIIVKDLYVKFRIYDQSSRSIKNTVIKQLTGGAIKIRGNIINVTALENINLNIKEGDRIGITGYNGSGKSTLLRTLMGTYMPTSGSVEAEGKISSLLNMSAGLDTEATGIENIYLRSYILGLKKKEVHGKIEGIREFSELGHFLELPIKTYSRGMVSRLNFAISTCIEPDILIIDEGIGTGDAKFKEKAVERANSLKSKAKILIMANHNKQSLIPYCNKIITMEKGKIVQEETMNA